MNKNLKRALIIGGATIGILLLIYIVRFTVAMITSFDNIAPSEETESLDEITSKGSFNVLLIGKDASDKLTDTMMMISVDIINQKINIISLMRDTRVKIGKTYGKLNAVLGRDKLDGLISCVKELTGAPIHYYVMVDIEGFIGIIDYLGGVEFDVPQNMKYKDPTQKLNIDLKKGLQTLDGNQSMQLVRFRKYPEGDVKRTRVQKDFMKALIEQKMKPEYLLKLPDLFKEGSKYVETNATLTDVIKRAPALKLFTSDEAVEIYEMPGSGQYVGKISYYLHNEEKTYALFGEHFLGVGKSAVRKYTDYGKATPPNSSGQPESDKPKEEPKPEVKPSETVPETIPKPLPEQMPVPPEATPEIEPVTQESMLAEDIEKIN